MDFASESTPLLMHSESPSRPAKRAASSTRDGPTAKRRPTQEVLPTSLHGLELFMAPDSQTGYRCVSHSKTSSARPFEVRVSHNGRKEHLGSFETAADAAYCFACYRHGVPHTMPSSAAAPSPTRQSSKLPPPLAADEALRLARAEGLNLLRDPSTVSGYRGVSFSPADSSSRPYRVRITWRGREEFIGSYRTVEEAALRYARRIRQLQQDGMVPPKATAARLGLGVGRAADHEGDEGGKGGGEEGGEEGGTAPGGAVVGTSQGAVEGGGANSEAGGSSSSSGDGSGLRGSGRSGRSGGSGGSDTAAASGTAAASTRSKRPLASSLAVDEEEGIHEEGRAVSSLPTASTDEATLMLTRVQSAARRASAASSAVRAGSAGSGVGAGTAYPCERGHHELDRPSGREPLVKRARLRPRRMVRPRACKCSSRRPTHFPTGPSSNGAPSSPAAGALGLLSDSESADLSASSGSAEGAVTPEGGAEYAGDENTVNAPDCV